MIKVSIIVPVYNSEKYLKKCLDSLVNQTLDDIEIIVINDGSSDNSEKIITNYQINDSRIKLINKKNGGQASARNLGLKVACGEYVIFIDSDDYAQLNMCEEAYNIAKQGYDIVCMDYYLVQDETVNYSKMLNDIKSREITTKEYLFAGAGPCNKIYSRMFLVNNEFAFPEGITYEDYAAIPSLARFNPKVYYLNYANFYYVQHTVSTMRSREYKKSYEDIFPATDFLYSNLCNSNLDEELEGLITYHLLYLGSLNFYKFGRLEQIDKISDYMRKHFPKWKNNKYIKSFKLKDKILLKLFYRKRYGLIKFIQKIKRCIR